MEQICLVEAGSYFVGVHSDCIDAVIQGDDFSQDQKPLLHLESFFKQKRSDEYRQPGVVLQTTKRSGLPDILVDRLVVEIDYPLGFESLPKLYPELAAQCCPQIFIYDSRPVMLLDVDGFVRCLEQQGDAAVFVELATFLARGEQENPAEHSGVAGGEADQLSREREELLGSTDTYDFGGDTKEDAQQIKEKDTPPLIDEDEGIQEDGDGEEVGLDAPAQEVPSKSPFDGVVQFDKNSEENIADQDSENKEDEQLRDELTEGEFARVVCWIIQKYLQWDSPAAHLLNMADVPNHIVSGVQGQVLDEVIAKTLVKCKTSSPEVLEAIMHGLKEQSSAD
jgi:hypothetical protein